MAVSITRRLALAAPLVAWPISNAWAHGDIQARLQELESRSGGRLGVAILDTATGRLIGNRVNERFAMCSTCKALVVAFVLSRIDRNEEWLNRRVTC
ncbi:serine hydrolase [Gluconacetobacter diazotrophicus]|uniref:beta-lactamase n=1 Tax=Gluconacetobacter diazotrophicus TaxID=33996 RepID=A0A7W4I882_GLUDI|nr:serine hydrolase [Gluconacetobacter diazotrophicus]MBB2158072.1 serine hydrolase [Gluconacetobacter diazotrophicus]